MKWIKIILEFVISLFTPKHGNFEEAINEEQSVEEEHEKIDNDEHVTVDDNGISFNSWFIKKRFLKKR
jgi:hypothetical protein